MSEKTIEEIKEVFVSFFNFGEDNTAKIQEIKNSLFISEAKEKGVEEEIKDLYKSYLLYFLCIVGKNEEIIKEIFDRFEKESAKINPSLKFIVHEIILKYAPSLYDDKKEKDFFDIIYEDFKKHILIDSESIQEKLICSFTNFAYSSPKLIHSFLEKFIAKEDPYLNKIESYYMAFNNRSLKNALKELMAIIREYYGQTDNEKSITCLLGYLENKKKNLKEKKRKPRYGKMKSAAFGLNLLASFAKREKRENVPKEIMPKSFIKRIQTIALDEKKNEKKKDFNLLIFEAMKCARELLENVMDDDIKENFLTELLKILCEGYSGLNGGEENDFQERFNNIFE